MSIEVAIKKSFPNMFRPLKWMHFDSATEYGKGEWFAHGARGTFHIYDVQEKFPNDRPYYAKEISDQFDTLEQAQAACQARNEGDILIGLSPEFISEIDRLQRENEELREDRDRTARNRDMYKGQVERQAVQIEDFRSETKRLQVGVYVETLPAAHLISVFADDMNERNWDDKRSYIKQQADRIRTALSSTGGEHHGN